jgi:uncharacterized protein
MTDTASGKKSRDLQPMRPIGTGERIVLIDILRGFALFGILLINIRYFSFPMLFEDYYVEMYPSALDDGIRLGLKVLVAGKFFSLFSFLFGLGMAVQLTRSRHTRTRFGLLYSRRLLILFVFGLIHDVFFWYGLVLIAYAVMGFPLLALKRMSLKLMVILAGLLVFVPPVAIRIFYGIQGGAGQEMRVAAGVEDSEANAAARRQAFEEEVALFRGGAFSDAVSFRIGQLRLIPFTLMLYGWYILAMFLFGFWSWQKGLWSHLDQHLRFFKRLFWIGLALGALGSAAVVICNPQSPPVDLGWSYWVGNMGDHLARCSLFACYVASIVLLSRSQWWRRVLSPLAAVGRTGFSNYILQTIICTLIFHSHGLGLYSTTSPTINLGLVLVIFAVQVIISNWWVRHFRFGPVEWLWRSLTYGTLSGLAPEQQAVSAHDTERHPTPPA